MAVFHNKRYGRGNMSAYFKKLGVTSLFSILFSVAYGASAFAGTTQIDDIAQNMVQSTDQLPALVSAISYLLGLLLGVLGILKIKEHVENPAQTALRVGVIRLLAGAVLFALPMIKIWPLWVCSGCCVLPGGP